MASSGQQAARELRAEKEAARSGAGGASSSAGPASSNPSSSASAAGSLADASKPAGVIQFRCSFRNTILDVLKNRGWKEGATETDFELMWADKQWMKEVFPRIHLRKNQKLNHFPNHFELTRKDLLLKNLKRSKRAAEKEKGPEEAALWDFFPQTYSMPNEYNLFVEEFRRNPESVWILKPIGLSQGKGIFLVNKLHQVNQWKRDKPGQAPDAVKADPYIAQRYIDNPYLIGGKKFDLRLYALITSMQPLTVHMYRSGFARFSNFRFSMDPKEIANPFVHLTNNAIQRTAEKYSAKNHDCKWSLRNLKLYLLSQHGLEAVNRCFSEIQQLVVRCMLSVQKVLINDYHCFELYGFDVLIDKNLKPWILEINASPSMSASTVADYHLKFELLNDVLDVVDIEQRFGDKEDRGGGFDLIYQDGWVVDKDQPLFSSYMGCVHKPRSRKNHRAQPTPVLKHERREEESEAAGSEAASSSGQ